MLVCVQLCLTLCNPMDCSPLSMGFSKQEYWSGLPLFFFLQGIFLIQGSNPHLLHWQVGSFPLSQQGCQGFQAVLAERESCIRAGCYHQDVAGEGHSAQGSKGKLKDRFFFFSFAGNCLKGSMIFKYLIHSLGFPVAQW